MRVLGVDGCKGGWAVVVLEDGHLNEVRFVTHIAELVNDAASVVAIDIPLGETVPCNRAADHAARAFMSPRGNVVFPTPPLATLKAKTYQEALALCRKKFGKGIASQSWHLGQKMLDAREVWILDPFRVREVHPECSFKVMAGRALTSKKHWTGLRDRLALLRAHGIDLILSTDSLPDGAKPDDIVDAAAAAWSAARIASDAAICFPEDPQLDDEGRQVAIWA